METIKVESGHGGIDASERNTALETLIARCPAKKVLLVVPDITRLHSMSGPVADALYRRLRENAQVDILIAGGSHQGMTEPELRLMYGDAIPMDAFLTHNWREELANIGEVPGSFVREVSNGLLDYAIPVQVNRRLLSGYDLVISVGQVIPHEVAGMANHSKNIFVGIGGVEMIHKTHFLGAVCNMEKAMGNDHAPVREVFDYACRFLESVPLVYVLTVVASRQGQDELKGLYIGDQRDALEAAVARSQEVNLNYLDKPLKQVVCYMEPEEFHSTWVANKAIYRTRMAIADGGTLTIIAPAVRTFGEDAGMDALIRKYGYKGTPHTLQAVQENADLAENLSAAAHLIHGSSEGRFHIVYAPGGLTREEVENVGFTYRPYEEAAAAYPRETMKDGFNGEVYYISNPALGLWKCR